VELPQSGSRVSKSNNFPELFRLVFNAFFASNRAVPDWIRVLLLGIIEGVTEFLPVSSTGHLIIAEQALGARTELFNVVIQTGAVMAVLLVFWQRVVELSRKWNHAETQDYLIKLATAFLITAAGGLLLKALHYKLTRSPIPVAWATLLGGVILVAVEQWLKGKSLADRVSWAVAITIGFAQLVAMVFPGSSRSGTTIIAALLLGLNRPRAAEFSFLLGIPTLLSAAFVEIHSAHKQGATIEWASVAIGFAAALVTAFLAVKWLLRYVQNHTFSIFGWYRIVLGLVILLLAKRL